jgi:hypothetical protein
LVITHGSALAIGQVVADEGAERLHRDVERSVHDPQHPRRHPQGGRVGHDEEREAREQRAGKEIRTAGGRKRGFQVLSERCPMIGWTISPVIGAAIHRIARLATSAPSVWKMRLTLPFCSSNPIWMPRKPKLLFQICAGLSAGLWPGCVMLAVSFPPAPWPCPG